LAEEIAMLSLLTEQPLHLGLGRGTAKYEYDRLGISMEESRERFEETVDIVRAALGGGEITYSGRYLSVPKPLELRPRVAGVTSDRIHLYGAIGSPASAEVMGQMGLPPMCTTIGNLETQTEILANWEKAATAADHPTDVMKPIMINCIVADTDIEAVEQAQEFIPRFMQAQIDHYTPDETDWEHLESYRAWRGQFAGMKSKTDPANIPPWTEYQLVGSPDTVARKVQLYLDAGFNHLFLHTATPGTPKEVRREWARRFALEVAPRFSPQASTAVAP
jgi:alkanesulfonate monooxygenase SsuD/methylene tetrahydromethanopterin reductase-like flavin-dependent oxidoreductase (luciferase family)